MRITDRTPMGEAFERGLRADNVQLGPDGQSVVLYDLTLVEDDGPGACTVVGHGRPAPTTIRGDVHVKKVLRLERLPARRAWLTLCVWPQPGEKTPLTVTVNGRVFSCRGGYHGYDWPVVRIPAARLCKGDNEIVLSCAGEAGWSAPLAQRADILRNDPMRAERPNRSFRSVDGGKTWCAGLGDDSGQEGELMVRLHLEQYVVEGELIGPILDLASLTSGDELPTQVRVESVRIRGTKRVRAGTAVEFSVRGGETPVFDAGRWGEWQPCGRSGAVAGPLGRFVQWRAVLKTTKPNVTPVVEAVAVEAEVEPHAPQWADALTLVGGHNEEIRYTSLPFEYERFDEPPLTVLREQCKLDEVVAGAQSEIEKMIKLRNWVSAQWKYVPPVPDYPAWDTHEILRQRRGICVQYAIVYMQCALSLGMQTRFVFGYFPNVILKGEGVCGHEVNEYWSNDLGKWVLMDAHQDECFLDRRTRVPVNMLELHEDQLDTYFPDGIDGTGGSFDDLLPSQGVLRWKGAEPEPEPEEPKLDIKWGYLHWMPRNNCYAHRLPEPLYQGLGWAWTGYRLWQDERTPRQWRFGHYTGRRSDIEWTLNQVRWAAAPAEREGVLCITMGTVTPDFDTFLVSLDGGAWRPAADTLEWPLHAGRNRLEMRVRNRAGVLGRVSWLEVAW